MGLRTYGTLSPKNGGTGTSRTAVNYTYENNYFFLLMMMMFGMQLCRTVQDSTV